MLMAIECLNCKNTIYATLENLRVDTKDNHIEFHCKCKCGCEMVQSFPRLRIQK